MLRFDLTYLLILSCLAPFVLIKSIFDKRFRNTFFARLRVKYNNSPKNFSRNNPQNNIWIHAASVGEAGIAVKLIQSWRTKNPDLQFLLSVGTLSGLESIPSKFNIEVILAPLDFSFLIKSIQKNFQLSHLVLIETELWPNMIAIMKQAGSVSIVNARLSDKHYKKYLKFKWLLKKSMASIDHLLAGEDVSAQRFINLGVDSKKIHKFGNVKFDLPPIAEKIELEKLNIKYKLDSSKPIFVAGSIQPEEVVTILSAIRQTNQENLQVVLIPRHPDKRKEFEQALDQFNIEAVFTSGNGYKNIKNASKQILIVDEIGVMQLFYQVATVIFVGGSLCNRGGQNMMEAIGYQKPVCVGPFATNFKQEMDLLLKAKGVIVIKGEKTLAQFIEHSLNRTSESINLAQNGYQLIENNSGALEKSVDYLNSV